MATWLVILIGCLSAVAVGVLLGYFAWKLYDKVDDAIDDKQRAINKLENQFAACGSSWMASFLEDLVVGDEESVVARVKNLVEAADTPKFFIDNIAMPAALYAIRESKEKYPEYLARIVKEVSPAPVAVAPVS